MVLTIAFQLELTSLRFDKIGTIVRTAQGGYDIGPFPNIGGPFLTTASFLTAWARYARYPTKSFQLLHQMAETKQAGISEKVEAAALNFTTRLATMVENKTIPTKNGPFPIYHPDLGQNNVVTTANFDVIGVIDWNGTCTLPWELVEYPLFLDTLPRAFDLSDKYDQEGQPLDEVTKERWEERDAYSNMIESAEIGDCQLSTSLRDMKGQSLAYAIRHFSEGKLGFYNRVLDQYT